MPRPEKVQSVQEIAGRFRDSQAALLTEYRGLHVSEIAEVRTALREADADYKVLKNTLARIAVREVGMDELVDMLEGPTAIAFCNGDAVPAAKALDEATRKFPVLIIKGGVLQGKVIGGDQARRLASLESREIQLGKIVTLVNTPLQQMVNVLAAPLRDLGSMLAQVVSKKESGELEAAPAPESAAPESAVPDSASPESAAPESAAPESAAPESAGSDSPGGDAAPEATTEEARPDPETAPGVEETDDSGDGNDAAHAAGQGMEE
jgi:large subunit ribosomal protein L10